MEGVRWFCKVTLGDPMIMRSLINKYVYIYNGNIYIYIFFSIMH